MSYNSVWFWEGAVWSAALLKDTNPQATDIIIFLLIWIFWPFKIISLILSRVNRLRGAKTGDPQEKPPEHMQAELGLYHMWPKLGLNPQLWDDL